MKSMEEKSLRVYDTEKTFFSKIGNTLTKFLTPGKMGINGVLISMKRKVKPVVILEEIKELFKISLPI